ncbi:mycofactocin-coupled SDR family oxidoreductase [Actinocorallia aurea]
MGRLDNKVAFITGAARGQGRAEAVRLASEGAAIIAIDINGSASEYVKYAPSTQSDLDETVRLVEEAGGKILAKQADVRDLAAIQAVVDEGVALFGGLDIVVANAGIVNYGRTWEITEEQWQDVLDTNLTGVWKTIKATVPTLIAQGRGGSIIITSSVAGLKGLPFLAHYASSKHGVVGLAKVLANELGEHDIRVNTVHPHGVATGMNDSSMTDFLATSPMLGPIFMPTLPYQVVEAEDIANIVAFLASDEGKFITGAQLPVDLGALNR